MAITRPTPPASAEAFISGAPDAGAARKVPKQQISLTIAPELLARVDALARELGQSRAAIITLAIHRLVEDGVSIGGR
jgi:hypothetical protein